MKGNSEKKVELSLLGIAKALKQDVGIELGDVDKTSPKKYRVEFTANVMLDMREASRERRQDQADFNLPAEKINSQGRVITGEMPVLFPIGFIKNDKGEIILTEGKHCMIAGNFTNVFGGTNCEECANAYDAAIREGKTVWVTPTFSQNGKWWMQFSAE